MKKLTFRGGTYLDEHKDTASSPTERLPDPASVSIPLSQHIGVHATPIVQKGDYVKVGQTIGTVEAGLGCPVHSSVSGTVREIVTKTNAQGTKVQNIIIDCDGKHLWGENIHPSGKKLEDVTPEEVVEIIRQAGISGLGGATFPTYAKLQSAVGKATRVIINCAECEPYITANHRLLLERGETVISGLEVVMNALDIHEGILAVEDNKMDVVAHLQDRLDARKPLRRDEDIRVCVMKTKYPQGDERQLVYAITGQEIPAGKLPADVGCLILNAETASAVSRAFWRGIPLVSRIVTVTGDCIKTPKNVRAPLGTSCQDLINFCGGLIKTPKKMISGGPMMGFAQWDPEFCVSKNTAALLFLSEEADRANGIHSACIHCGRCVAHCPMHLMPNYLTDYAHRGDYEKAEKLGIMNCVECGTCSYNCPAGVEIVQYIRVAKNEIRAMKSKKK